MKAQVILLVAAFLKGIQADKNPLLEDRPIFLNPDLSAEELEYLGNHKIDNDVTEAAVPAEKFGRSFPTELHPNAADISKAYEFLREQERQREQARERERHKKKCSECSGCPCKCDGQSSTHPGHHTWTHTGEPTGHPTGTETDQPTGTPTDTQTGEPTGTQTGEPTGTQTDTQTGDPTGTQTGEPTGTQTGEPTGTQTGEPTGTQTGEPTGTQTNQPTDTQTGEPTGTQTNQPTDTQTGEPTGTQTNQPTDTQTGGPTGTQTNQPTDSTTMQPEVYTCTRVRPCENVCTHTHHKPHLPIPTEVLTNLPHLPTRLPHLPTYLSPKMPYVPGPGGAKRSHPANHNLTARHECTLSTPCNKPCHHTAAVPGMETKMIPDVAPTGVVPVRGNDTCGDNCPTHVPVSGGVETAAVSGVALLAVAAAGFLFL